MDIDRKLSYRKKRPPTSRREEALARAVSPCSEYTRYTVEGRFGAPASRFAAILDPEALGVLFPLGPFTRARWSGKLGYGMAVIGEDTRVHLHDNGRYIVRRALDRTHVERCMNVLVSVSYPALYVEGPDLYMWELVRDISFGIDGAKRSIPEDTFIWEGPWENPEEVKEAAVKGFLNTYRELEGKAARRSMEGHEPTREHLYTSAEAPVRRFTEHIEAVLGGERMDPYIVLGISSCIILMDMIVDSSESDEDM